MKTPLDNDLNKVYETFNWDHDNLRESLMASLPKRLAGPKHTSTIAHIRKFIGGTIMKSRITKLAAAAVIIMAGILSITLLDKSVTPAYAIEQTIEASRGLRYLYFEYFVPGDDEPVKKCWVEFDKSGQPEKVRVNMYKHWGDRLVAQVWKEGKTLMWLMEENTLKSFECEVHTAKILKLVEECDPRTAVESLYEREQKGEVEIAIDEPSDKTEAIVIKGTFLPGKYLLENPTLPSFRDVLYVDQTTKLITAKEIYELNDGQYEYNGVWKYRDYEHPFDTDIFNLEDEVPANVMRFELYTGDDVNNVGLAQGALTDKEIAFVLVQEFFEALLAKDYTRAGQLFGGMPAYEAEEKFGMLNVVRIVSISEPVESKRPHGFRVPCIIEIENDGDIFEWQPDGPFVREVYRHAGRWRVIGWF